MSFDHEQHDPQPDCDCHACAIWERNKLREIVGALHYPFHADDRRAEQAKGKHPAPCARFCEANAFEIGERMLRAQIHEERKLRTEFAATVERCYRMLLSEPGTKGGTAPEGHNAGGKRSDD